MGVEKLIAALCVQRPKGRVTPLPGTKPTCHVGVSPFYPNNENLSGGLALQFRAKSRLRPINVPKARPRTA